MPPHVLRVGLFVDPDVRAQHEDIDAAVGFAVDATNELVHGVDRKQTRLCVHLCRRAGARVRGEAEHEGGYATIVDAINRLQVDAVTMEFSGARAASCGCQK